MTVAERKKPAAKPATGTTVRTTCGGCGHTYEARPEGGHRVLCGDATDKADVARLFDGEQADVVVTDPPYGVDYERSQAARGGDAAVHAPYTDTHGAKGIETILPFLDLLPADVLVMTFPVDRHFDALGTAFRRARWEVRKELVWVKDTFSFWPGAVYQQQHEPILLCARPKGTLGYHDVPANQPTVFQVPRPRAHDQHPTQKPMELWGQLVLFHTPEHGLVFDPFGGSGTTLAAAEQQDRRCYTIELAPQFCDAILLRWINLTGLEPVRADGVRWAELTAPVDESEQSAKL